STHFYDLAIPLRATRIARSAGAGSGDWLCPRWEKISIVRSTNSENVITKSRGIAETDISESPGNWRWNTGCRKSPICTCTALELHLTRPRVVRIKEPADFRR